jgi:predicted DNA-binding antitoxin AbrB/MazE fold protein
MSSLAQEAWGIKIGPMSLIPSGPPIMTLTVEAIYENGVLKPATPLPLKEQEKVLITIEPELSGAPACSNGQATRKCSAASRRTTSSAFWNRHDFRQHPASPAR